MNDDERHLGFIIISFKLIGHKQQTTFETKHQDGLPCQYQGSKLPGSDFPWLFSP
jgi:hypothetical protein